MKVHFDKRDGRNYPITWTKPRSWVIELAGLTISNLFLDFNVKSDKLLQMWIYDKTLKGSFITKEDFFKRYLHENSKAEFKEEPAKILEIWKNYKP